MELGFGLPLDTRGQMRTESQENIAFDQSATIGVPPRLREGRRVETTTPSDANSAGRTKFCLWPPTCPQEFMTQHGVQRARADWNRSNPGGSPRRFISLGQ